MTVKNPKPGERFYCSNFKQGPISYVGKLSTGDYLLETYVGQILTVPADDVESTLSSNPFFGRELEAGQLWQRGKMNMHGYTAEIMAVFSWDDEIYVAHINVDDGSAPKLRTEAEFRRVYPVPYANS